MSVSAEGTALFALFEALPACKHIYRSTGVVPTLSNKAHTQMITTPSVSYTHLTLPTILLV